MQIDIQTIVAAQVQKIAFRLARLVAALGGAAALNLTGDGPEPAAQHDVDHPLVGGIAIFERHLFGQNINAQNGFGRNVLDFVEAGNPVAVQQHHRSLAPSPVAANFGRQFVQKLGDGGDAKGLDIGGRVADLRRYIANDRARPQLLGFDRHRRDRVVILAGGRRGCWLGRLGRRRRLGAGRQGEDDSRVTSLVEDCRPFHVHPFSHIARDALALRKGPNKGAIVAGAKS